MIKINLLPVKRSKKREAAARELAVFGGIVAVVVVGLYVWYAVMESQLASVQAEINRTTAEIARIDQDIVKVDEYKKKKRELEQKLEVIEDLKAKKVGPVRLLDELAINIPKRVWLTSFEEKNGTMILEGGAADNDEVADFLSYMTKRTKFFDNVTMMYAENASEKPVLLPNGRRDPTSPPPSYVKFKLSGSARYGTMPMPKEGKDGKKGGQ